MTTHELLELAALDALGLLDVEEREAFENAFRAASPALQAQIRRDQLRVARAEDTLPSVEAPLGLRARVLAAVRDAMQTSGIRRAAGASPALHRAAGISSIWRIGAIGSLAAAIVFGVVALQIKSENQVIQDAFASGAWGEHFRKEFGDKFDQVFFAPNTRMVSFAPSSAGAGNPRGHAALLFDPTRKRAQLYCKDLPFGEDKYEVVLVDEAGNTAKAILVFEAAPGVKYEQIDGLDLSSESKARQNIVIRKVGSSEPILTSTGI